MPLRLCGLKQMIQKWTGAGTARPRSAPLHSDVRGTSRPRPYTQECSNVQDANGSVGRPAGGLARRQLLHKRMPATSPGGNIRIRIILLVTCVWNFLRNRYDEYRDDQELSQVPC